MIKGTLEERLALRKDEKFIVETILPAGEVHLIGGASGAGKTTWLLWWLREWSEGRPVFGLRSFPVPFVYVSFDRGLLTLDRTLRRLRMDDWNIPAYDIAGLKLQEASLFNIVKRFPDAQLYVIEGFQGCLNDAPRGTSQNKADMLWSMKVRQQITNAGKTVLGITHSPKMKQGESYVSSRSRFLGTQSLLASTGTLITFDNPKDVQDAAVAVRTEDRDVLIEGPNFPSILKHYTRDNTGGFLEKTEESVEELNLDIWMDRPPEDETITTKQLMEVGLRHLPTRNHVNRWITKRIKQGRLMRLDEGLYQKIPLSTTSIH